MIVRHHHEGRVYEIEFPEGSRVYRCKTMSHTVVWVPNPDGGLDHFVPDWPGELLVQLAKSGAHGFRLVNVRLT